MFNFKTINAQEGNADNYSVINVTQMYGLVVISALVLCFQCVLYGYLLVSHYRKRVFNKPFLQSEYGQIHKDVTGSEIQSGGYPDMGCGFYAQRLDYGSWLLFNKAQRIHNNFLETLPASVLFLLIGGLKFPITSAVFGFVQVFGRFLSLSYVSKKGSTHPFRILSSFITIVSILTTFILSFILAVQIIKGL